MDAVTKESNQPEVKLPVIDYSLPEDQTNDAIPTVGDLLDKPLSPKNLSPRPHLKKRPAPVIRHLVMNEHRNKSSALESPSEFRARNALTALSSPHNNNPRKLGLAVEAKHIDPRILLKSE